ncbi:tRNA 2-thiouridine(34) synthase MnmA [Marinicella sp. W31]|uniref:tRNA 2-thiouridine(34) synthase MnmA n=1 Tax=Marinicella sp. W31 TaxID=3023713 RepID=UPI0037574CB2
MGKEKIIVGMSGGVDSSVSAALLLKQGYAVEGMFMKNWEEDDTDEICTADADVADAQSVCDTLGIKLHKRNFSSEYWDFVFEDFLQEYKKGRTPNPDILCNREIKFKTFLQHAQDLGSHKMATGHYVRRKKSDTGYQLLKGLDNNKDQSYFLYTINQEQLAESVFPVGEIDKSEVRDIAAGLALQVHDKKDSTGICFIGEKRFQTFLSTYLKPNPGDIVTVDGHTVGRHNGLMYYTIGQRQGLGIGGVKNRPAEPWFVLAKEHKNNRLIVGQDSLDGELLLADRVDAIDVSWIAGHSPQLPYSCHAKIRYRQADQACTIRQGAQNDQLIVEFEQSQRAATPGQSIVFYAGDVCLGGAIIDHSNRLTTTCEFKSHER